MRSFWSRLQAKRRRSLQSRNSAPLFLLGGFVFSTLFFTVSFRLAEGFFPRSLTNFDLAMFHWFEGMRFASGDRILLAITRLGNTSTLVVVVSCVSLSFILWRRHFEAALFGGGAALTALRMTTTKWLIGRPRPASPALPVLDGNPAFPSGHVAVGGVVMFFSHTSLPVSCEAYSREPCCLALVWFSHCC